MSVERRSGLSYEDFVREYLVPRKPVILVGALDACPARKKWSPEYFKRRFGHKVVPTDSGPMHMADVVDGIQSAPVGRKVPFLRERPVPWMLPELLADLDPFPSYASPNWFEYPFARWADPFRRGFGAMLTRLAQTDMNITGAGVNFPNLHLDRFRCHAFIMQWYGRKDFFVFSPEQTPALYPDESGAVSRVNDIDKPDLERFPLFADVKMLRLTLNPGEALFNPTGWWHTTRTLDPSIATVISFANGSNWAEVVRAMVPRGRRSRVAFAPVGMYLRALGRFRLPSYRFADPSKLEAATGAFRHFQQTCGASCPSSWEITSAFTAEHPPLAYAPALELQR